MYIRQSKARYLTYDLLWPRSSFKESLSIVPVRPLRVTLFDAASNSCV